jgi:hypothetical protein
MAHHVRSHALPGLLLLGILAIQLVLAPAAAPGPATERMPASGDPVHVRFVMELPAVDLPALADHHDAPQPRPQAVVIPGDGWVTGFRVDMLDAAGDPVPPPVLHHVQLFDPERRDLFNPYMLRVVGAGGETGGGSIPWPFAYRVHAGDTLLLAAMLHNPLPTDFDGVRVRVTLDYGGVTLPGRVGVVPFFHHVTDPWGSSSYDLPPGRSEQSWVIRPEVGGRILALGGHLHRYGVEIRLEEEDSGRLLWRGTARLDDDGHVRSVTRGNFLLRGGLPLHPDRSYRVVAVHDNPTGETLPDQGMGTLAGVLLPARGSAWPRTDRSDPLYLEDLARQRNPDHGGHGEERPSTEVHGGHRHHASDALPSDERVWPRPD